MSVKFNSNWGSTEHQIWVASAGKYPNWVSAPSDVWKLIFFMLSHQEQDICTHVCRRFEQLIFNLIPGKKWKPPIVKSQILLASLAQEKRRLSRVRELVQSEPSTQVDKLETQNGTLIKTPQYTRTSRASQFTVKKQRRNTKYNRFHKRSHHQNKKRKPRPRAPNKLSQEYLYDDGFFCDECGIQTMGDIEVWWPSNCCEAFKEYCGMELCIECYHHLSWHYEDHCYYDHYNDDDYDDDDDSWGW